VVVWWAETAIAINEGNNERSSIRSLPLGPDAVLRSLGGAVALGPPASEADGAAAEGATEHVQPDVSEHPQAVPVEGAVADAVPLTFYVCVGAPAGFQDGYCGRMASGAGVYRGAAACGYVWPLGTRFTIEGDSAGLVYTCEDRGLGSAQWVDIWFYDYASGQAWRNQLPIYVTVRILP